MYSQRKYCTRTVIRECTYIRRGCGVARGPEGKERQNHILCVYVCMHWGGGQRLTSPHLRRHNSWRSLQHHKSKASTAREQLAHLQIIVIINHSDFTPFSGPLWRLSSQAAPAPGTRGSGPGCAERCHGLHFDAASAHCWVAHNAQPAMRHGRLIHPAYRFCIINISIWVQYYHFLRSFFLYVLSEVLICKCQS